MIKMSSPEQQLQSVNTTINSTLSTVKTNLSDCMTSRRSIKAVKGTDDTNAVKSIVTTYLSKRSLIQTNMKSLALYRQQQKVLENQI